MTRWILFDLDGTLVDHRGAVRSAIEEIARRFPGSGRSVGELIRHWRVLEHRHMAEYLAGRCSYAEQRRRRLRDFLPLLGEPVPAGDPELDAWYAAHYLPHYTAGWRSYPDVAPCLAALRARPAAPRRAVLTNGEPRQQRAKLDRCGLLGAFEAVLTPEDLGAAKPDAACFLAACRTLGADPRQTVYVGDWLEGDAVAAARAGLAGIWLDRGEHPVTGAATSPADVPDDTVVRIDSLRALADLL